MKLQSSSRYGEKLKEQASKQSPWYPFHHYPQARTTPGMELPISRLTHGLKKVFSVKKNLGAEPKHA